MVSSDAALDGRSGTLKTSFGEVFAALCDCPLSRAALSLLSLVSLLLAFGRMSRHLLPLSDVEVLPEVVVVEERATFVSPAFVVVR